MSSVSALRINGPPRLLLCRDGFEIPAARQKVGTAVTVVGGFTPSKVCCTCPGMQVVAVKTALPLQIWPPNRNRDRLKKITNGLVGIWMGDGVLYYPKLWCRYKALRGDKCNCEAHNQLEVMMICHDVHSNWLPIPLILRSKWSCFLQFWVLKQLCCIHI